MIPPCLDTPSEFFSKYSWGEHVWLQGKAIIPSYRGAINPLDYWYKQLLLWICDKSIVSLAVNTSSQGLAQNIAVFKLKLRLQWVIDVNCKIFGSHNAWILQQA